MDIVRYAQQTPSRMLRVWLTTIVVLALTVSASVLAADRANAGSSGCRDFDVDVSLTPGGSTDQHVAVTLCEPARARGVQILLPGSTYNRSYFDFPYRPAVYSYTRYANRAGFATLNVDRIGYGESSHPDSSMVNWDTHAAVIDQLVTKLRAGEFGTTFTTVVTVGHSMGTLMAFKHAADYGGVDAVIGTGMAHPSGPAVPDLIASFYPAVQDPKFEDSGLDNGYLTSRPGTRDIFYDPRTSDPRVIAKDEELKDTTSTAESANLGMWKGTPPEASMTKDLQTPVLMVLGAEDGLICGGDGGLNCSSRQDVYEYEKPYFPNAPLSVISIPVTGHDLNLSWTAPMTYLLIQHWVKAKT